MRTPEELKKFNDDDMTPLVELLKAENMPYTLKRHAGAFEGTGNIKDLLGYYPTGEWHIIIDKKYSVIRGMVSFGYYEMMSTNGDDRFPDTERFETPEELIKTITQ